jgi:2-keto-3-deoxy-L-arabinonate dehydratase
LAGRSPTEPALAGVLCVLATPFEADGSLDEASLGRLVEHVLGQGVDGVVCLGLASESYKLTDRERRRVVARVTATVAQRVPVVVGVDHNGAEAAAARCREATELGADAVMAYPPSFVRPEPDGVAAFYVTLAGAAAVPVVVQDAPTWTGVALPVELLLAIQSRAPNVRYVKVEAPPAADKIARLADAGLHAVGGYGALHLPEEVNAGIVATLPGCALAGLYRDLWRRVLAGDADGLWALHADALPLLAFQIGSLDLFVAVQKLVLARAGVIASARVREPATPLTSRAVAWLDLLLARTRLDRYLEEH